MIEWYFLLTPIVVLAVLLLFRFVGCNQIFDLQPTVLSTPDFHKEVIDDAPVINLRLQENSGAIAAKNEIGPPDGSYVLFPTPLDAGDPNWKSTAVDIPVLEIGLTDEPRLVPTNSNSTSVRVHGAWVSFPADWSSGGSVPALPEFTLEALVYPEWTLEDTGKYYCVMAAANSNQFGFGLYAGPDGDATTPYTWQFWVGSGLSTGFQKFNPMQLNPGDPGPTLAIQATYLAITLSTSPSQVVLYMYYSGRDISHTTYILEPSIPYVPFGGLLNIGIAPAIGGPLFPPIPPSYHVLYPFQGRIAEVAIYDKALGADRILAHGMGAFNV